MTSIALTIPLVLFHAGTEVITKSSMWSTALAGFIMVPVAHFMIKDDQYRRNPLKRVKGGISLQGGIWMLALGSSLAYVVNVIMALLRIFELFPGYSEGTSQAIYSNSFLVTAFCGAIVAPVAEEYLFRGLVYGRIRDYLGVKWGIVLSALIFGAFHGNMAQFIYAGLLGLVFAWALEYYQTITAPILLHVAANLWSFVLSYFATPLEKIGNGLLLGVVLCVQFVVVILSLVFIIRQKRED
jgi:hypothetical protein